MKNPIWAGLALAVVWPLFSGDGQSPAAPAGELAAPLGAAAPELSLGAAEVMRLAAAGTSDDVLVAYIQNATAAFNLSADQILYLRDLGLSSSVITAMLNRDNTLRSQLPPAAYPPPAVAPAPAPVPAAAEVPAPGYVSAPPAEVTYFYEPLLPYGTWIQLGGLGWCWQPCVVALNRAWRPYCDSGHWLYTDAGWYWASDYSWGWAPFHYGRWHLHERCGWVWLPDRTWGPAWVTWRAGGDRCGWAPLPPHADFDARLGFRFNGLRVGVDFDFGLRPEHFTFIALRDFHERDLARRRLAPGEVARIYPHTAMLNDYGWNNNLIVNRGLKVEQVAAATHWDIQRVPIRDAPPGWARLRGGAAAPSARVIYRPELKAPVRPVPMVAQRVDERHPVVRPAQFAALRTERRLPSANGPFAMPSAPSVPSAPGAPSARPAPTYGPSDARGFYPLRTGAPAQPSPRAGSAGQPLPGYYPKTYHQAAETHMLPPINPRSTAPAAPGSPNATQSK